MRKYGFRMFLGLCVYQFVQQLIQNVQLLKTMPLVENIS